MQVRDFVYFLFPDLWISLKWVVHKHFRMLKDVIPSHQRDRPQIFMRVTKLHHLLWLFSKYQWCQYHNIYWIYNFFLWIYLSFCTKSFLNDNWTECNVISISHTPQYIPKLDPHPSTSQSVFSEPQPQLKAASGRKTNSFLIFNCYPSHWVSQALEIVIGRKWDIEICIL